MNRTKSSEQAPAGAIVYADAAGSSPVPWLTLLAATALLWWLASDS